jgi:uncharacterized protein YybS (DUF2232 family)
MRWLIAAACGLAAALCNLAPQSGGFGGLMLSMIAPMPIFLAGLLQGWVFSLAAGALAAGTTMALGGVTFGLLFAGMVMIPAALLVRQALLAQNQEEGLVWYPVTYLAYWVMGIGAAIGLAAAFLLGGEQAADIVDGAFGIVAGDQDIPEDTKSAVRDMLVRSIPAFVAGSAVLSMVLNGAVAQRIAERSGRAVRPKLAFTELRLPAMAAFAMAGLSVAGGLLPGFPGQLALIGASVAGLMLVMQGLAVAHIFARSAGGAMPLVGLYVFGFAMLLLMGPILLMALMLLGVTDAFFGLRRRSRGGT